MLVSMLVINTKAVCDGKPSRLKKGLVASASNSRTPVKLSKNTTNETGMVIFNSHLAVFQAGRQAEPAADFDRLAMVERFMF